MPGFGAAVGVGFAGVAVGAGFAGAAVGAGFAALFAWRQARAAHPLLEPSLLKNRGFTSGLIDFRALCIADGKPIVPGAFVKLEVIAA